MDSDFSCNTARGPSRFATACHQTNQVAALRDYYQQSVDIDDILRTDAMLPMMAAFTVIPTRREMTQYAVSTLLVGITSPTTIVNSVGSAQFRDRMYTELSVKLFCVAYSTTSRSASN